MEIIFRYRISNVVWKGCVEREITQPFLTISVLLSRMAMERKSKAVENFGERTTQSKSRAKTVAVTSGQRVPKNPMKKLINTAKKKLKPSSKSTPTSVASTMKGNMPPSSHKKILSSGNKMNSEQEGNDSKIPAACWHKINRELL